MNKKEIRKALNVPDDLRICQHIYNVMREYEKCSSKDIQVRELKPGNIVPYETVGIDIFYVEDEEFIEKLSK